MAEAADSVPAAREGRAKQRWLAGVRLIAGCVPVVDGKIILISNRKDPQKWGLPKGGWETDEASVENAAVRETWEECGAIGSITASLSVVDGESKRAEHANRTSWFVLHVTDLRDSWPEMSQRLRQLVTIDEAITLVSKPEQRIPLEEVMTASRYTDLVV